MFFCLGFAIAGGWQAANSPGAPEPSSTVALIVVKKSKGPDSGAVSLLVEEWSPQ